MLLRARTKTRLTQVYSEDVPHEEHHHHGKRTSSMAAARMVRATLLITLALFVVGLYETSAPREDSSSLASSLLRSLDDRQQDPAVQEHATARYSDTTSTTSSGGGNLVNSPKKNSEQETPVAAKNPDVVAKAVPIHEQTLAVIAPDHPEWDDIAVHKEFQKALKRIKQAKIDHYPHAHFSVPDLFSDKFYAALMRELPPPSQYKQVAYPGTDPVYGAILLSDELANRTKGHVDIPGSCKNKKDGCWVQNIQFHDVTKTKGMALTVDEDSTRFPLWVQAFRFVHSRNFTNLLYSKFAFSSGIPAWKQEEVMKRAKNGVPSLRNTAALRIEPTSYHLSPHVDRYEKLVTW